ncbi:MAG: hypothetical protein IRZ31_02570 [Thermogemmatispora sp.]|uniref:hypothetical protein n=1 Tax=Thermogemmatispora sp. TaxID=1968838 RepID=UPI00261A67E6|nr:hypothetical protein [Thermogemmatispora sp.]MBX5455761.1 hypothetical protein [Thermogemmatispora sp.]
MEGWPVRCGCWSLSPAQSCCRHCSTAVGCVRLLVAHQSAYGGAGSSLANGVLPAQLQGS